MGAIGGDMAWVTEVKPHEELVIDNSTRISFERRMRVWIVTDRKHHRIVKRPIAVERKNYGNDPVDGR